MAQVLQSDVHTIFVLVLEMSKVRPSSSAGYFAYALCVCVCVRARVCISRSTYKYLCGNKCFKRIKYVNASVATNDDNDPRTPMNYQPNGPITRS